MPDANLEPYILFTKAGEYTIEVFYPKEYPFARPLDYPTEGQRGKLLHASVVFKVEPPQGNDKTIVELLSRNTKLGPALLSTIHEPDDDVLPKFRRLVTDFPNSRYADYARFALARDYLQGTGYHWFKEGYNRETFQRVFVTILSNEATSNEQLIIDLKSRLLFGNVSAEDDRAIREAVAARKAADATRQRAIARLVELAFVSVEERQAAIRLLEEIRDPHFPYLPTVLAVKRIANRDLDEKLTQAIDDQMNQRYRDSVEWITLQNDLIGDKDEWREFRVQSRTPVNERDK